MECHTAHDDQSWTLNDIFAMSWSRGRDGFRVSGIILIGIEHFACVIRFRGQLYVYNGNSPDVIAINCKKDLVTVIGYTFTPYMRVFMRD